MLYLCVYITTMVLSNQKDIIVILGNSKHNQGGCFVCLGNMIIWKSKLAHMDFGMVLHIHRWCMRGWTDKYKNIVYTFIAGV